MKLADYLEKLKAKSGGTITDCQVNCVHVGVMRGLRVIGWPWSRLIAHTVRSVYSNLNIRRKISIRFAVSLKEVITERAHSSISKFESQTCAGDWQPTTALYTMLLSTQYTRFVLAYNHRAV